MNTQQIIHSNKGVSSSTYSTGPVGWPREFSDRLIQLSDGRPGLRAALSVEAQSGDATPKQTAASGLPIVDFISSNATLDRYEEVIRPEGWRLEHYRRNPVFQNAHQYGDIIFTLGKALITEIRTAPTPHLFQRIEFAVDINPMARIAYGLYKNKFLNAVSVGFIPLRWRNEDGSEHNVREFAEDASLSRSLNTALTPNPSRVEREKGTAADKLVMAGQRSDIGRQARRVYLEQELLEVSAVGIPANPEALQLGLRAGVLQKTDLKELLELLVKSAEGTTQHIEGPSATSLHPVSANPSSILHLPPSSLSPSSSFSEAASNTPAGAPGVAGDGAQLLQLARVLREVLRRS